jgi:AMP nucleosidase
MTTIDNIPDILDALEAGYTASVDRLRAALSAYAQNGVRPDPRMRDEGAFSYPELRGE